MKLHIETTPDFKISIHTDRSNIRQISSTRNASISTQYIEPTVHKKAVMQIVYLTTKLSTYADDICMTCSGIKTPSLECGELTDKFLLSKLFPSHKQPRMYIWGANDIDIQLDYDRSVFTYSANRNPIFSATECDDDVYEQLTQPKKKPKMVISGIDIKTSIKPCSINMHTTVSKPISMNARELDIIPGDVKEWVDWLITHKYHQSVHELRPAHLKVLYDLINIITMKIKAAGDKTVIKTEGIEYQFNMHTQYLGKAGKIITSLAMLYAYVYLTKDIKLYQDKNGKIYSHKFV